MDMNLSASYQNYMLPIGRSRHSTDKSIIVPIYNFMQKFGKSV